MSIGTSYHTPMFDYTLSFLYIAFGIGVFLYFLNVYRIRKYIKELNTPLVSMEQLRTLAFQRKMPLPKFAIFVPARSEGDVIANTIKNLEEIAYPKSRYTAFIVTDERELAEQVEARTKDVAWATTQELNLKHGQNFLRCVEIPKWYSGKSTKGRALNYALQHLVASPEWGTFDMIGVLDADGRFHSNVLREAAHLRLYKKAKLLQGPVYQITNFAQVSLVGIAAGLELAIHHLTELPDRLRPGNRLQFLAGTNYFIDKELISAVGGWNQHALVEDAELALRLYIEKRICGHWLNVVEKEQTPPSFKVYRKQRERWARGHLRLLGYIQKSNIPFWQKIDLFYRIFSTQYRSFFDVGLLLLALCLLLSGALQQAGLFFTVLSFFFLAATPLLWDLYGFMYRQIAPSLEPAAKRKQQFLMSAKLFLFMPVLIFIQAIPRVEALYNHFIRRQQVEWYKTARTKEV